MWYLVLSNLLYVHSPTKIKRTSQKCNIQLKLWCECLHVYSMQHYVVKIVSYSRQVGGFLWVLQFPPPIKLTATICCWMSIGTLISTACKLFHDRIAEGKYEFWWLCILENDIWNFWSSPLVVLLVAGLRYICESGVKHPKTENIYWP